MGAVALANPPGHDRIERSFAVDAGQRLVVDVYRGAVLVEESDRAEVSVTVDVEVQAETPADAAKTRGQLELTLESTADGVRVAARHRQSRVRFVWDEDGTLDLVYRIVVPRRFDADVRVRDGCITVGNLVGRVRAEVETGSIFVRRIDGAVEARADFGDVVVSRCTGDLTVQTTKGTIRAGTIGGRARLRTGSGEVELVMAHGPVDVQSTLGDAVVGFPREVRGAAQVRADGGNVRVKIDPAARCTVLATARWGRVTSALGLRAQEGAAGSGRLRGELNGGGPLLTLRADGGSVVLEPGETWFELAPEAATARDEKAARGL